MASELPPSETPYDRHLHGPQCNDYPAYVLDEIELRIARRIRALLKLTDALMHKTHARSQRYARLRPYQALVSYIRAHAPVDTLKPEDVAQLCARHSILYRLLLDIEDCLTSLDAPLRKGRVPLATLFEQRNAYMGSPLPPPPPPGASA